MPRVIVVKLGTALVTEPSGRADEQVLTSIARQVALLWSEGRRIAVVSSGAVGAGAALLGMQSRPRDLPRLQAAAAVGQPILAARWSAAFQTVGLRCGQVLVTREDIDDRGRFLNVRNTVDALWRADAVPVINENDTVSTAELASPTAGAETFGDNDRLAAAVASALSAEMLVLLSTVPGLLDADGRVVECVADVADVAKLVRNGTSVGGTGGMASKLAAARLVTAAGETMVLADGRSKDALLNAVHGKPGGTRFEPATGDRLRGRLRWVAHAAACGRLTLDAGAVRALQGSAASLLPAGVSKVDGTFARGDVVELCDDTGHVIGRGVVDHDADTCRSLAGKRSSQLGGGFQAELVHRDSLVMD